MIRRLKRYPQTLLHSGCGAVAVWFLMAELQGETTMPVEVYGQAGGFMAPALWAAAVIFAVWLYLCGWVMRSQVILTLGSGLHFGQMALLSWFCVSAPGFTPIAPWTALLTVTLALCFWANLGAVIDAQFEEWP